MHLFWKKIEKREVNFFSVDESDTPLVLKIFFFLSNVKFAQKNEKKVKILELIKNLEIGGVSGTLTEKSVNVSILLFLVENRDP